MTPEEMDASIEYSDPNIERRVEHLGERIDEFFNGAHHPYFDTKSEKGNYSIENIKEFSKKDLLSLREDIKKSGTQKDLEIINNEIISRNNVENLETTNKGIKEEKSETKSPSKKCF